MKRIGIAFLLAFVVLGVAWVAADAKGPDGPVREKVKKIREFIEENPEKFPLVNSEEFKAEKERHRKAMKEIMAEGKELRAELRKEILALWKKHFPNVDPPKFLEKDCEPKEKDGEKPSAEEMKKMRKEMKKQCEKFRKMDKGKLKKIFKEAKELADKFAEKNKDALKKIAGKAFDEKITHRENVTNITKNMRAQIIDAHYNKVLLPNIFRKHWRGMRHDGPKGKGDEDRPKSGKSPKDED